MSTASLINKADGMYYLDINIFSIIKRKVAEISQIKGHAILIYRDNCPHCAGTGNVYFRERIEKCVHCSGRGYIDNEKLVKVYSYKGEDFYLPTSLKDIPQDKFVPKLMASLVYTNKDKIEAYKNLLALALKYDQDAFNELLNTPRGYEVWNYYRTDVESLYRGLNG